MEEGVLLLQIIALMKVMITDKVEKGIPII